MMQFKHAIKINSVYLLLALLVQVMLYSCHSELEETILQQEEQPMQLSFLWPDDGGTTTRAKTAFEVGDLICVTAMITVEGQPEKEQRSTVLKYTGTGTTGWTVNDGSAILTWPADAVSADFTAYHLPKAKTDDGTDYTPGVPIAETPTVIPLQHIKDALKVDDPLIAKRTDIKVNAVAMLQFVHTTTKFVVTGLKHGSTKKVQLYNDSGTAGLVFNNQFVLSYSAADGYSHSFRDDALKSITQDVTISANSTQVVFFLNVDPASWETHKSGFKLQQLGDGGSAVNAATDLSGANLHTMQTGRYYRMYFYSSMENTALTEEKNWHVDYTPKKFNDEADIRKYFAGLGNVLNEDLDFNNIPLSGSGLDLFTRSTTRGINLTKNFDGQYHTIYNIRVDNGFFESIPSDCELKNLQLENITVQAEDGTTNYAGLLTPLNEGKITNVRIDGINILGTNGVTYVGGMVGLNRGTISGSKIMGTLAIDCYAEGKPLYVGGFVGSNGEDRNGSFAIQNCEVTAGTVLTIAGNLGTDPAYMGGFAGFNAANKTISGSATNVNVDARDVLSGSQCVGGFIGLNRGKMSTCEASGHTYGGTATTDLLLGGFLGHTTSVGENTYLATIDACSASGNVYEKANVNAPAGNYGIGGFGGFAEIDLLNCSSVGTVVPSAHAATRGALVGLYSADMTITNSFSTTGTYNFTGMASTKTANCHLRGEMLDTTSGSGTGVTASKEILNNARKTGWLEWTNSSIYSGVPYLIK